MTLSTILSGISFVVTAIALSWVGNLTTPLVSRLLQSSQQRVLSPMRRWREARLARAINRIRRIIDKPSIALADMIMAMFVAVVGGGYGLAILVTTVYLRLKGQTDGVDLVPFLGGAALVWAGLYRASNAYSDLTEPATKIAKLKAKAERHEWDIEDACAALLGDWDQHARAARPPSP